MLQSKCHNLYFITRHFILTIHNQCCDAFFNGINSSFGQSLEHFYVGIVLTNTTRKKMGRNINLKRKYYATWWLNISHYGSYLLGLCIFGKSLIIELRRERINDFEWDLSFDFQLRFNFRFLNLIQSIRITDLRFQWNPKSFGIWHVLYVHKPFLSIHCSVAALLQCIGNPTVVVLNSPKVFAVLS